MAAVFEGWYPDTDAAEQAISHGRVKLLAAQDSHIVVPLAGVASPSMAAHVVVDMESPAMSAWAVLNEGNDHALRFGTHDPHLIEWHRWLNGVLAPWLTRRLDSPLELLPLIDGALAAGDDCHSRTMVGSRRLADVLLGAGSRDDSDGDIEGFLSSASSFALNLWMAAVACAMRRAGGISGSSLITAAGGNGTEFGIQLAGAPRRWFCRPAEPPRGLVGDRHAGRTALGAVGDSAILDIFGLGGMAVELAPEVRSTLGDYLPSDAIARSERLLAREHPDLGGVRRRVGLTASRVVEEEVPPIILLGMIDGSGEVGRVGGGVYQPPVALFADACAALPC
ncbi:MAG: oxamate carbamoyltransferase subunit AllG family protein [Acidimicrobiales bacterium]